jgi:hypothetical protein
VAIAQVLRTDRSDVKQATGEKQPTGAGRQHGLDLSHPSEVLMLTGAPITHLVVYVHDIAESSRFYHERLGLPL